MSSDTSTFRSIRIVCVSDTHNDDPSAHIPDGEVFVHAGDMTNQGTQEELTRALEWIRKLPHKQKIVIAGNHDSGLDPTHKTYNPAMHELFTSAAVRADGVVYLDPSSPMFIYDDFISVYGNPKQPNFLGKDYAFLYRPFPSPEAAAAWESAPKTNSMPLELWLSHGAPKGRLDKIIIPFLKGCEAQWEKVVAARPLLCLFGHFHPSYGVEKVVWRDATEKGNPVLRSEILTNKTGNYDLTTLVQGKETVFVNAAWMTGLGAWTKTRNKAVVMELKIRLSSS